MQEISGPTASIGSLGPVPFLPSPRLGVLLRDARKRRSSTRRRVAGEIGATTGQLRQCERGDASVPPSLLGALAECYGEDLVAQVAVRAPIQVDARRLVVGTEEVTLGSDDIGELLGAYVAIVARLRHAKAGAPIALRADDLAALSTASGQSSEQVEARIAELLDCALGNTPSLHAELQRRKPTLPYAGVVSGIAIIAAVGCSAAGAKTLPGPPALPHHLVAATRPVPTRKATERPRPDAGKIHRPVNTQAGGSRSTTVPTMPNVVAIGTALTETASTTIRAIGTTTTTTNLRQAGAVVTHPPAITTDTTPISIPPNETVVPVQP
jgi:transcriptional regulator with XRE-family HTH domain